MDNVKTVKLLNFNVYVKLLEDDADEFMFEDSSVDMKELNGGAVHLRNEKGQEGCVPDSGQKKKSLTFEIVVHECWHCFWFFYDFIAEGEEWRPIDIGSEIFAYSFGNFVNDVWNKLCEDKDVD